MSGFLEPIMPLPEGRPSPIDNPVANSGFQIITARKASRYAASNTTDLYQKPKKVGGMIIGPVPYEIKNQLLEWEPVYTMENADSYVEDEQKLELPVLSALNGLPAASAKAVDRCIKWWGFARGETANEHVPGNSNGAVAIVVQGVLTVMHSGVVSIPAGATVCLRAPTEEEAALQIFTGRQKGKAIGLLEEYKPNLDAMDAANGFESLMNGLGVETRRRDRDISEDQAEAFDQWWQAQRVMLMTMFLEFSVLNAQDEKKSREKIDEDIRKNSKDLAVTFGLVRDSDNAKNNKAIDFQKRLLKRIFVRDVFPNGMPDEANTQLFFPLENSTNFGESRVLFDLARLQKSAVENQFNAIIGAHARRLNSIIGRTPTGGVPGGSIDLVFKGCISQ